MSDREQIYQDICAMGRRLYEKGFAAANDGNISCRLSDNEIVCTPTMLSKGNMTPDDLCTVDTDGQQLAGKRKRSSEILLHLQVYRQRPDVRAVVHCHPPHATAFAVAHEAVPQSVLPEVEIFLGEVPIAPYETPGRTSFSDTIAPFVERSSVIILANHGTVSFASNLEHAYWWTEILESYCRILMLARQLGPIQYISEPKCRELLVYKQEWGCTDPRVSGPDAGNNVCGHQAFRDSWNLAGVGQRAFAPHPAAEGAAKSGEGTETLDERTLQALVEQLAAPLADEVAKRLSGLFAEQLRSLSDSSSS